MYTWKVTRNLQSIFFKYHRSIVAHNSTNDSYVSYIKILNVTVLVSGEHNPPSAVQCDYTCYYMFLIILLDLTNLR